MARARRQRIAEVLRHQIVTGLASGALRDGDRLPSTRQMALDLHADQRVVAEAYRALVTEGLVELRARSGVFVAALPSGASAPQAGPSRSWLVRILTDGVRHGVAVPAMAETIAAATRARTVSAIAITPTLDQAFGLARELRDDFGFAARGYVADELRSGEALPSAIRQAHLVVGTEQTRAQVARLATRLQRPHIIADVRPDLLSPEWRLLMQRLAYVVVADPRFVPMVREFLATAEDVHDVRVLIAGRDDLSTIPAEAATYVTEAARQRIGRTRLPGRLLAATSTMSDATIRELAEFIVAANQTGVAKRARKAVGEKA